MTDEATVRLLLFHADWCGPCGEQKSIVDEIESEYDIDVERHDVDTEGGQSVANEYSVRSLPTIVLDCGDTYTQFSGLTPKEEITEQL